MRISRRTKTSPPAPERAASPTRALVRTGALPDRAYQELWFALARQDWRSVVFVPADAGGNAAADASALAEVGKQLHDFPVTLFIMESSRDYWPATQIVAAAATGEPPATSGPQAAPALDYGSAVQMVASAASPQPGGRRAAGKVIVAVQPVVDEPLGLSVTQAADVVVLCVEMGRTRLASARRTIELVGRDRIAGCFLKPRSKKATRSRDATRDGLEQPPSTAGIEPPDRGAECDIGEPRDIRKLWEKVEPRRLASTFFDEPTARNMGIAVAAMSLSSDGKIAAAEALWALNAHPQGLSPELLLGHLKEIRLGGEPVAAALVALKNAGFIMPARGQLLLTYRNGGAAR